jgi:hypothetical protein
MRGSNRHLGVGARLGKTIGLGHHDRHTQTWLRLAQEEEQQPANRRDAAERSELVVQRQQQFQPKGNDAFPRASGHAKGGAGHRSERRGRAALILTQQRKGRVTNDRLEAHRTSNERPDDWPADVRAISQEGLSLFGIKEGTGQLFWDGKQVRTRSILLLGGPERWIAGFAAAGAFGTFLVNLFRFVLEKLG